MNEINVIWRGKSLGKLVEDNLPDQEYDTYHHEINEYQGVATFNTAEELLEWWEQQSVSYGEEGGRFSILGGWIGTYEELKTGKTRFMRPDELNREMEHQQKQKEKERKEHVELP